MSWGTCYKGSNNIHAGFPALMSDGSWGRDWEPACANNNHLKKNAGISNNYQYRQYLMQNADAIIKKNQTNACENCCTCWENFQNRNFNSNRTIYYKITIRIHSNCLIAKCLRDLCLRYFTKTNSKSK